MATLTITGAEATLLIRNQYSLRDTDQVQIVSLNTPISLDFFEAVRTRQKLVAIKLIRELTNCGLKEGKDFVDEFSDKLDNLYRF
tara:strand:+ start:456 stop:710 length:255 start_codon:yes stop_codon:yes gene_type:complete